MSLQRRKPMKRTGFESRTGYEAMHAAPARRKPLARAKPLARTAELARTARLKYRSDKTAARYVTRRRIVADLFAVPSVCEVPWCTNVATDPHEPLTRARGGDILDRSNIRLVCHEHNVMFASDEQPWMYELGFLRHSWEVAG